MPKLYKNPTKIRFLITAPKCKMKPLSKAVTAALKLIYNQIESNQSVNDTISKLNSRSKATSIFTFDLSTLYPIIPHDKLKPVMPELINFCFYGGNKEFIGITRYGAIWTKSREKQKLSFNKTSLKMAILLNLG